MSTAVRRDWATFTRGARVCDPDSADTAGHGAISRVAGRDSKRTKIWLLVALGLAIATSSLPVEQAATFDLTLNLATAEALRVVIPVAIRQQAARIYP